MKNRITILFIFLVLINAGCSSEPAANPLLILVGSSLEAAISSDENCTSTINFEDLENNVYGYRIDALFAIPGIQTGGHSTIDESTDLGFNLFFDPESTEKENYIIDGSSGINGTSYVFYIVGDTEYFSSDDNTEMLKVETLELDPDGNVATLEASFNNVQVVNVEDTEDIRCINSFKISFYK